MYRKVPHTCNVIIIIQQQLYLDFQYVQTKATDRESDEMYSLCIKWSTGIFTYSPFLYELNFCKSTC